jgi:hypothetical protein
MSADEIKRIETGVLEIGKALSVIKGKNISYDIMEESHLTALVGTSL